MWSLWLTGIFGALFVLFGLPLLFVTDPGTRLIFGGMSTLSLGGFAVALSHHARSTGRIKIQQTTIERAQRPRLFEVVVTFIELAGFIVIAAGLWAMFFKH